MGTNEISLIIFIILGLAFLKSISSNSSHKKEIRKLKEQDALPAQPDLDQGDDIQSDPVIVNGEKKYSPYSLEYIGRYKIRKSIFDSAMEMKIYPELRSFIHDDYYVMPQVGWKAIFQGKSEYMKISTRVTSLSFDFVIFNQEWQPVLCIEIYGKYHLAPEVIERDNFKRALLEKNNIAMVVVDAKENIKDEDISGMLVQCIKKAVPDREHYPVYCPRCQKIMKIRKNSKTGEDFYGCSMYKRDGSGCSGHRNMSAVPPLYENIPVRLDKSIAENTSEENG